MSYLSTDPCLKKAHEDEMLFVLMARDETAPEVVMEWVRRNLQKQPLEKLVEVIKCAQTMADTQRMHYKRSHPPTFNDTTTECPNCRGYGYDLTDEAQIRICLNCNGIGWGVINKDDH